MPAVSDAVRALANVALNNPEKLQKKNRGILKMGKEKLKHYAQTRGKLPARAAMPR